MNKKSIDRKAAKQFVTESRNAGKTDQEIYNELSQQYFDKKGIVLLITSTVTAENKNKYKIYNGFLLAFIGCTILFKVLAVFNLSIDLAPSWALLLIFVVPLINAYLFYEVARYSGYIYRIVGVLTIVSFLQNAGRMGNDSDLTMNIIFSAAIAGLAFYLDANMFPKYSPRSLRKNANGEYMLS